MKLRIVNISQEVVAILGKYLSNPESCNNSPTREFLSLSGAWEDTRSADTIVGNLRAGRKTANVLRQIMPFLIDTDILLYSLKCNPIVHKNILFHESHPKVISVISYGELLFGAQRSEHIEKNLAVARRIRKILPVIEVSKPVIETFASIKSTLSDMGKGIDDMDLLIASTALTHNYTLVTNNEKHFKRIDGLAIDNWIVWRR